MSIKFKIGMVQDGKTAIYERSFSKRSLKLFNDKYHWGFNTRVLILIKGE
jgi:hypothetical protein